MPPASATATASLTLRIAGRPGPTFALDPAREHTLGRAQNATIVLADRLASRTHATVRHERGEWLLRDLDSRNGTWVDGTQVSSVPLVDGAVIRIGTSELLFRLAVPGAARPPAGPQGNFVRCGPVAELEGSVLRRSSIGSTDDARRPLLLYQASIRLLSSRSVREVIGTTLELAVEHSGATAVGWFSVLGDERLDPVCVVPPGTGLARMLGDATSRLVAREGNAVWVAPSEQPGGGAETGSVEIACVPIVEHDRVRAAIVASAPKGALRSADFDFLVALGSLASAACAGHARGGAAGGPAANDQPADLASQQTVDLDPPGFEDDPDHDEEASGTSIDRTVAFDAVSLQRLALPDGDDSPAAARIGSFVAETSTLKLGDWQRMLVIEALRRTGGSVPNAAAELGISLATLQRKLELYGLTKTP